MEGYELVEKISGSLRGTLLTEDQKAEVMIDAASYLESEQIVQAFRDGFEPEDFQKLAAAFQAKV